MLFFFPSFFFLSAAAERKLKTMEPLVRTRCWAEACRHTTWVRSRPVRCWAGRRGRKVIPLQLRVRLDTNFTSNREADCCCTLQGNITSLCTLRVSDTLLPLQEHMSMHWPFVIFAPCCASLSSIVLHNQERWSWISLMFAVSRCVSSLQMHIFKCAQCNTSEHQLAWH